MPGGTYITRSGRRKGKEGEWMLPRHTTSVSSVSLSVESQVFQPTETIFSTNTGRSFILRFDTTQCPFIRVDFESLVNDVESFSFNWDIRALTI